MITIIAIHGNGGGGFRFAPTVPYMPDDVVLRTPTLPGFADMPRDPHLRTMRDFAEYIHTLITPEPRPRVLLGTGIGGAFALEVLQHDATAIDGVILHAPVGARLESRRFPALMKLPGARAFGKWLFSSRLTQPLFQRLLFEDHASVPPATLDRFFREYRACQVFGQMFDLITAEWYNTLSPVEVPAALLWGAEERVLSPDHIADYQALLPESRVRVVEGWNHFPMIEQPQTYATEIATLARALVGQPEGDR